MLIRTQMPVGVLGFAVDSPERIYFLDTNLTATARRAVMGRLRHMPGPVAILTTEAMRLSA